jgi:inner membrane protein
LDSLTQFALGAAVGEATLGRKVGRRALLWGGICGTLPDLDVLVPFGDAVQDFIFHRSASHSLFVLALLAPLVAYLITRIHPQTRPHYRGWLLLVFLALSTHVLLDSLTVFGTQIFWPWGSDPVTWGTIFIIDPLYTVPLLVGVLAAWLLRSRLKGRQWNQLGLTLSCIYLVWTVGAKVHVNDIADHQLASDGQPPAQVVTMPTPFNSLLWRVVAVDQEAYRIGYYSLLQQDKPIQFERFPRNLGVLAGLEDHEPVRKVKWFTKGFYAAEKRNGDILMIDLRAGLEPDYEYFFKVGELQDRQVRPVLSQRLPVQRSLARLPWLWDSLTEPRPILRGALFKTAELDTHTLLGPP